MNVTLVYNCKYGKGVAPFMLENDSWRQIYTAIILSNPCRITFPAENGHTIGLFAYSPAAATSSTTYASTSITTTYAQSQAPMAYIYYYAVAAVLAAAVIAYLIIAKLRMKK